MKKVLFIFSIVFIFYSCKNLPDRDGRALPGNKNTVSSNKTADTNKIDSNKTSSASKVAEPRIIVETDKEKDMIELVEAEDIEIFYDNKIEANEEIAETEEIPALPSLPFVPITEVPSPSAAQAPPVRTPPAPPPPVSAPPASPSVPPVQIPTAPSVTAASPAREQESQTSTSSSQVSQSAESEQEQSADTAARRYPPPVVRETLPVPTPSTSMIVPLDRNNEIIFSRIVRATVGQIIEIPFRGTGWVYLGELASRRGIAYDSRRNDPDGLSFIFKAEEAGTYALKFSRHDFVRDYILNDHVQVVVGEAPAASIAWFGPPSEPTRIVAQPRWPSASEEAEILRGEPSRPVVVSPPYQPSESQTSSSAYSNEREPASVSSVPPASREQFREQTQQASAPASSVPVPVAPNLSTGSEGMPEQQKQEEIISREQLVQRAKDSFESGNVQGAISLLDQYIASFPTGVSDDELYWLYGQFYEANSPARDIKLSLDYYKRLTSEFPQSMRFNDARRRIAYLERFYINIQ